MEQKEQVVFAVSPATDGGAACLIFGIPEAAWEYMRDGKTHMFDLTKIGFPLKIVMYGAPDHGAAMNMIAAGFQVDGVPFEDRRNQDFSIEPKPGPKD